ncbi:histidine kinase N-terminal domain-containing protein [Aneurinibacillus aneurinilyticus]|jgi:signal transduction histidine kinase|nr:histidine kinase N-terminal domain-containing protein [Aneurinibacillus aneurinilyticus]
MLQPMGKAVLHVEGGCTSILIRKVMSIMDDMKRFTDFLKQQADVLVREWREDAFVSENAPFRDKVFQNGIEMYEIVIQILINEGEKEALKRLACQIVEERIEAGINIGEFVYNVNGGRSRIFKCLTVFEMSMEELQPIINRINECFDVFLYYAVSHYTELKNKMLEEKSVVIDTNHKDRLSILGQMTSSFVHEFRNPLTSIKGFIKLLKTEYPDLKYIDIIDSELEELNFRVSQFLMLSKKEIIGKEKQDFYMEQLINQVLNFLYPSFLNHNINVSKDLACNILFHGYYDEIRQVLINILFNAIEALHAKEKEKKIEISLQKISGGIVITVSNNGPIIEGEVIQTIFEPFFTTKDLGTGLGLFVCKQIIEKHEGTISIHSNENRTIFSIHLPYYEG